MQLGRLPYSRAACERTDELGERWLAHHADIEDQLVQDRPLHRAARETVQGTRAGHTMSAAEFPRARA
jgi:hypothetical protein